MSVTFDGDRLEAAQRQLADEFFAGVAVALRKARQEAALSTQALAELLGVSRNTVTRWERDPRAMTFAQVSRWAELCGVGLNFRIVPWEVALLEEREREGTS